MTTTTPPPAAAPHTMPAIRRAVMRAMLAPSTHNTQPWRFVAGPAFLDLFADRTRALAVIDPDSRQLVISCGAALWEARLSLAADGLPTTVELLPDPDDPDHLARIAVRPGSIIPDPASAALDRAGDHRHTNRRVFTSEAVPDRVISGLQEAAAAEGAFLQPLTAEPGRSMVIAWTAEAEGQLFSDPAYRAELRAWAGRAGSHDDGIPPESIPEAGSEADRLPVRGFDQFGTGRLPAATGGSDEDAADIAAHACLLLLATDTDDRLGWLHAGQALGRVLAELTEARLVAGLYTQLTEVHRIRQLVRTALHLGGYPHLLIRVGHAERTPPTPRRAVPDILTVVGDTADSS